MNKSKLATLLMAHILVPSFALADGLLPPKTTAPVAATAQPTPPQAIEIKMPDGTLQKGFIQDGKFIQILSSTNSAPVASQAAPQITGQTTYTQPLNANLHLDQNQHLDQTQHIDQNVNQNIKSNNYNASRVDHDRVDTVRGYGDLFLRTVTTFGSLLH